MDPLLITIGAFTLIVILLGLWHSLIGRSAGSYSIEPPIRDYTAYDLQNEQSSAEKDASAGVLPMETPHRELLHKRDIYQLDDLKAYDRLVDISYVGAKRAEKIAHYLSAHVPDDTDWPEEIQSRI